MTSLDEFSYLWDGSEPGWVLWLLGDAALPSSWAIINVATKMALLIDDNDTFATVISELRLRNAPIITEFPT